MPSATSGRCGAVPNFSRPPGTDASHGKKYEIKMAAFLFARALHKTEDFQLASNVRGFGVFDDLVFRYRLRDTEVWKTCFVQLKHKRDGGNIQLSSLLEMSGDFSLFKYFESYCLIKSKPSTDDNMKHCGSFNDFKFVIYTSGRMGINSVLQVNRSESLSILSSGKDCITFDEAADPEIFTFFKELSEYHKFLVDLDKLFARGTFGDTEIVQKIQNFQDTITNKAILDRLKNLKSGWRKGCLTGLIKELAKCDFNLYKVFLSKVKIFHSQSSEISLKGLTERELNVACKVSLSVAKSI